MNVQNNNVGTQIETKFCKECGQKIAKKAVICPHCGCQVEEMANQTSFATPNIVINNSNQNTNQIAAAVGLHKKNKWIALLLWLLLGAMGGHKFYEGKIGMGILYIFTFGLFGIGLLVDLIVILCKPVHYYPR